jgi:hypothetical protein
LYFAKDLQAAAEGGLCLGPVAHSLVDLAKNTMGRTLFEREPVLLGHVERHARRPQCLAGLRLPQVELS